MARKRNRNLDKLIVQFVWGLVPMYEWVYDIFHAENKKSVFLLFIKSVLLTISLSGFYQHKNSSLCEK